MKFYVDVVVTLAIDADTEAGATEALSDALEREIASDVSVPPDELELVKFEIIQQYMNPYASSMKAVPVLRPHAAIHAWQ